MPIDVGRTLKDCNRARVVIERLTDKAQEDLLYAISCINTAVDSDRRELLLAAAQEYLHGVEGKLRLAAKVAKDVP